MQNIIIDEEFRIYLPTLDKVTYEGLEKMLLEQDAKCLPSKCSIK